MRPCTTAFTFIACLTGVLWFQGAQATPASGSGQKVATCYGVYDALLDMADVEKLSKEERDALTFKRDNAQAIALMLLDGEGVDENAANDLMYTASYNMKQALGDRKETSGHDGVAEMHRLGAACDKFIAE